jgi:hypothetical protein
MPSPQYNYWSVTIWCDKGEWVPKLDNFICWIAGQKEICPTTRREHWQVAFHTPTKKTYKALQTKYAWCKGPWGRLSHSRSEAADEYVLKLDTSVDNTKFTLGQRKMKRNSKVDWAKQLDLAKRGLEDQIDPGVYLRCYSTIKKIKAEYLEAAPDAEEVTGLWIWGPPGSGKSRLAREAYPGIFDKPVNKWWDGYRCGPALLDDFDKCHKVLGHFLKRWTDRYSFSAEVKGGTINIRPPKIVITSNYSIDEIFGEDESLVSAIKRRCTIIYME